MRHADGRGEQLDRSQIGGGGGGGGAAVASGNTVEYTLVFIPASADARAKGHYISVLWNTHRIHPSYIKFQCCTFQCCGIHAASTQTSADARAKGHYISVLWNTRTSTQTSADARAKGHYISVMWNAHSIHPSFCRC